MSDHEHDHGCDHELPSEVTEKYDEFLASITGLDSERRNLFIEEAVLKTQKMIELAITESDPMHVKTLLSLSMNSLNLVGLANASFNDEKEDWTRVGDRKVGEIWDGWIEFMTSLTGGAAVKIFAGDLPEDTRERFAKGEATTEDLVLVRAAAEKAGVKVPDGVDLEFGGVIGVAPDEKSEAKGTGLYL